MLSSGSACARASGCTASGRNDHSGCWHFTMTKTMTVTAKATRKWLRRKGILCRGIGLYVKGKKSGLARIHKVLHAHYCGQKYKKKVAA